MFHLFQNPSSNLFGFRRKHMLLHLLIILWASETTLGDYCVKTYVPKSCRIDLLCTNIVINVYNRNNILNPPDCSSHNPELYITIKDYIPTDDETLRLDINFESRYICGINLANNDLHSIPNIFDLDGITSLNFSHNDIVTAKFYDYNSKRNLHELDLSYNTISEFEQINKNENDEMSFENEKYFYKSLEKLNLSNNYIVTIPDGTFSALKKLKILNLSHNFIDFLSVFTFDGLTELEVINLSYNRIVDINKSFIRFVNLKELYLDHNKIHEIDNSEFANNVNLMIMSINYNKLTNLKFISNLTKLEYINVSHNLINTLGQENFLYNLKLNKLDMSFNDITILPKNLGKGKNFTVFDLSNNKLSGCLENGHFKGMSNITILDFSNQQFIGISNYAFDGVSRLSILLLNKNKITNIAENSFKLLNELKYLDLSHNQLTKVDFDKSDLVHLETLLLKNNYISNLSPTDFAGGLYNLQLLNLENNNITSLKTSIFEYLHDVTTLRVSNNPIHGDIEGNAFSGLISLPVLHISETNINCLKNNSFNGMGDLKTINMSHNQIQLLEYNCFSNVFSTVILDLSYNCIEFFMVNNSNFKKLESLILSNNKFKNILSTNFVNIKSLLKLDISHNDILEINDNAFHDQTVLEILDMSNNVNLLVNMTSVEHLQSLKALFISGIYDNSKLRQHNNLLKLSITYFQLKSISAIYLNNTKRLTDLTISHTNISYIDSKEFSTLLDLENLDLSYNQLTNIQPGSFKHNVVLQKLNVSHNKLCVLNFGIFRGLSSLNLLDLSYNMITKLNSERFHEIPSLNTIIVDHNNISMVKLEDFGSTNLRVLSIGENPLPCEILVKFRHHYLSITAIKLDHESENVDGVTCNKNYDYEETSSTSNSDIINTANFLNDFKNILYNVTNRNNFQNKGADDSLKKLNNFSIILDEHLNKTETILSEYMQRTYQIENNSKSTNNILRSIFDLLRIHFNNSHVDNTIYKSFNNMTENKTNINIDLKIMKQEIISELQKTIIHNERDQNIPSQPSKFTEVCVGLILCSIICYVLYLFYNSKMFVPTRRTMSTRQINESIESPNL